MDAAFNIISWGGAALCLAFFLAGIIDVSSGGGGLLTIPTFLAVGFPAHYITGTNHTAVIAGAITSLYKFAKSGNVHWFSALTTAIPAIIGSFLGAKLNMYLDSAVLTKVMIVITPIIVVVVLIKKNMGEESHVDELPKWRIVVNALIIGLLVGAYQGFYAAGSGTFFLLSFVLLDKLDLLTASGNIKIVGIFGTLTSTITYALSGYVMWQMALVAMAFYAIGTQVGCRIVLTNGVKAIRPMFIGVLILLIIRLSWTLIFG